MKLKFLLPVFMIFILSSFVSAIPDNGVIYYNLTDLTDKWSSITATNNGATSTTNHPIFGITGNSAPNSYSFVTNDDITIPDSASYDGNNITWGGRFYINNQISGMGLMSKKLSTATPSHQQFSLQNSWGTTGYGNGVKGQTNKMVCVVQTPSGYWTTGDDIITPQMSWETIYCTFDGTNLKYYRNGTLKTTLFVNDSISSNNAPIHLGWDGWSGYFDGDADEIKFYSKTLTAAQIKDIHNYGEVNISSAIINESTETNIVTRQSGSVILTGSFQTIENTTFNISVNDTETYFTHVFQAEKVGGADSFLECQLLVDGVNILSINRTINANTIGNIRMVSNMTNLSEGEHTEVVQCLRPNSGGGTTSMSNGVSIGHIMIDENLETLNNEFYSFTFTNFTSSYTEVAEINFSTTDFDNTTGVISNLVVDWSAQYDYNSTGDISTYIQIDGVNCSEFNMGGTAGDSFIAGGACGVENSPANSTVNIKVFAKDSGGVALMNIVVKELLLEPEEIVFSENVLNGINITSSTLTDIGTFSLSNIDKALVDLTGQIGIAVKSNSGVTTFSFQAIFNGTKNLTTNVYERTVGTSGGVVNIQDVLEAAPIGDYDITLYVACANSDCTITGSNGVAYFSNLVTETSNSFNLSVFDNYDNSVIEDFNVTLSNGLILTTTLGSILVFTGEQLENMTIQSDFNGGYFQETVTEHNTSNNLNVSMNQTLIGWDCLEKVSGNDLNCTSPTESQTFNYNVLGNPHSQSVNVSGYFENTETFNVTALQSQSLNSTFYSTNLTLESVSALGTPTNCTYNITSLNHTFTESVYGSPNTTVGLINGTYSILADCSGFAYNTQNITIENTTQTTIFNLLTTNSINISFYDINTNTLMTGINITVQFIGTTNQTIITDNGTLYVDLLSPDEYTIIYDAEGYRQGSYILNLESRSYNNLVLYMDTENNTQLLLLTVKDTYGNYISNSEITIQRYFSNAWITEQIRKTDFQGRTEAYFVLSTIFYNFLVSVDGTTYFGTINSNANKKQIYAEDVSNGIEIIINRVNDTIVRTYQSLYGITTTLTFVNTSNVTGYFRFSWDDSTNEPHEGVLKVYKDGELNCTISANTEAGIVYCYVNESGTALYVAQSFLDDDSVKTYNKRYTFNSDIFIDWGALGYAILFIILVLVYFLYLESPTFALYLGGGVFTLGIFYGLAFSEAPLTVLSLIMALTSIVAGISSKSGGNG